MSTADHYAVLGVLPDAEDVVISAAYRALAQRYHPDKWQGETASAHERMSRINEAYSVLGDRSRRAEYDKARKSASRAEFEPEDNDQASAFDEAMNQIEDKWALACNIFPDLIELRARLSRVSASLAFAFVTILLDSRAFPRRTDVAAKLERTFLQRYFGTDSTILEYATFLILDGQRAAAKKLNVLVDVLGSEVDPQLLIESVDAEFKIDELRKARERARQDSVALGQLKKVVRTTGLYANASVLAKNMGYKAEEIGGGFFTSPEIEVTTPDGQVVRLINTAAFTYWVQQNLCGSRYSLACSQPSKMPRNHPHYFRKSQSIERVLKCPP